MPAWLFQMTTQNIDEEPWGPNEYRLQVSEGEEICWTAHKVNDRELGVIIPGDPIILYFTRSKTKDYGIYGWGIITKYSQKTNKLTFIPVFPSDYLKMAAVHTKEIDQLVDRIRMPTPHSGTMWALTLEELNEFRKVINNCLFTNKL